MGKRLPSNWRDRLEITEHRDPKTCGMFNQHGNEIEFHLTFKKGQTPKGFRRNIGQLEVNTNYPHYCASEIDEYFCKRGLGTLLYTYALNKLGSLTTEYHHTSRAAKELWKSLIGKYRYETNFFECELTIFLTRK